MVSVEGVPILAFFVGTIILVMTSIEAATGSAGAHIVGQRRKRNRPSLRSTVSSLRCSRSSEANTIRAVWSRSEFPPEPNREETKTLLREYVHARASAFQSTDDERIESVIDEAEKIQLRLWVMAVKHARQDMPSDIGALRSPISRIAQRDVCSSRIASRHGA